MAPATAAVERAPLLPRRPVYGHPLEGASLAAKALISWVSPVLATGNRRQLDQDDVWALAPANLCAPAAARLAHGWMASGSFLGALVRADGALYAAVGLLYAAALACDLLGPVVLNRVVALLADAADTSSATIETGDVPTETVEDGAIRPLVFWLGVLLATRVLKALLFAFVMAELQVVALRWASALKALVFQKALRLSAAARARHSAAELVNLYATDVQNVQQAATLLHQLWALPLELAAALVLLYRLVGPAAAAGLAVILVVLVLNHLMARAQAATFARVMAAKDSRMAVVTELLGAMLVVKFNAWERKFGAKVTAARAVELAAVWRYLLLGAFNIFLLWGAPVFVSTTTFAVLALGMHVPLEAATIFPALALFRLIQEPLRALPRTVTGLIQAGVSLSRLLRFMDLDEVDPLAVASRTDLDCVARFDPQDVVIAVQDAAFAWDESPAQPLLRGIELTVARGELVVLHGRVGSGKSSLLSALLGEMSKRHGSVYVGGAVAYCAQQHWLQNMSLRDNILFGQAFDRRRYMKVLDACGLLPDLARLPAGDLTEIGQKGLNLSGGQKARISLARACYSDADIFLLDAPLAAVDAIVAHDVFTKCVLGLLRHKTRVLVSHNPDIIASPHVDAAFLLRDGMLERSSSVEDDVKPAISSPLVSPLVSAAVAPPLDRTFSLSAASPSGAPRVTPSSVQEAAERSQLARAAAAGDSLVAVGLKSPAVVSARAAEDFLGDFVDAAGYSEDVDAGRLVAEEHRHEGRVSSRVFVAYLRAVGGARVVILLLVVQAVWQLLQILSDLWLAHWTGASADEQREHVGADLLIYSALALGSSLMVLARSTTVAVAGLRGARQLFERMTAALLLAPMTFFDANPLGRLLNRYSDDVSSVDFRLPFAYGTLLAETFFTGCTLLTAVVVVGKLGLLVIPVLFAYAHVGRWYLRPARELQRLQRTSTSPVLAHMAEAVDGAATIRAFGPEQVARFEADNYERIDLNNRNTHLSVYVGQWFALRVQLLGGAIVVGVAAALVSLRSVLSAGVVGLAFNYALSVDEGLQSLVQAWSWLETSMVAPERLQEYVDVPPEAPHVMPMTEPSAEWPAHGAVVFEKVSFRYRPGGDLVLRDVSFQLSAAEKIGVVGRTGAGKSSLLMALFRINELAGGRIVVDGVDVSTLGLHTLRSRLSVVTQAPVLFRGSLRGYLDPFDELTDEELWTALRRAGLATKVGQMDGGLLATLDDNGDNLSVGERQMLCLARALLRASTVVVMDEATAAVDHETDRALQRVVRDAFRSATVLTIAHRLDTVLDADRILVLDGGQVAEFDAPATLLAQRSGRLYDLAREGGYLDRLEGDEAEVAE